MEIYNFAVATRESTCDLEPTTVAARRESFSKHTRDRRPIWVAEDADAPGEGVVGYLSFHHFMNERPGYFIAADLALYLHPDYQNKGLGTCLLGEAIRRAPSLGIEVLAVTIFASNAPSIRLFTKHGFERWGVHAPRRAFGNDRTRPRHDGAQTDLIRGSRMKDRGEAAETDKTI